MSLDVRNPVPRVEVGNGIRGEGLSARRRGELFPPCGGVFLAARISIFEFLNTNEYQRCTFRFRKFSLLYFIFSNRPRKSEMALLERGVRKIRLPSSSPR